MFTVRIMAAECAAGQGYIQEVQAGSLGEYVQRVQAEGGAWVENGNVFIPYHTINSIRLWNPEQSA